MCNVTLVCFEIDTVIGKSSKLGWTETFNELLVIFIRGFVSKSI